MVSRNLSSNVFAKIFFPNVFSKYLFNFLSLCWEVVSKTSHRIFSISFAF